MTPPARDLIDRFGREEEAFLKTEFIAPVAAGGKVRVRIAGVVCELEVAEPREGWAVLKPLSHRRAEIVREATRAERARYLGLFPRARLVATTRYGDTWLALPAASPEKGAEVEGLVPIALAGDLRLFQTVVARFDGALFLLESTDRHATAEYLRGELRRMTEPAALSRRGLTEPERRAYAHQLEVAKDMAMSAEERRLRRALEMAGGSLRDFSERGGVYTVAFTVDGVAYTSLVGKRDLGVVSAGVCLSGRDRDFDLTSLVSVLRQHRREGRVH